jgi:hypothetical protein
MWEQQLAEIKTRRERRGRAINDPASSQQIGLLKKTVKEKFNQVLPQQYLDFLRTVNGLEDNGFIFYGVDNTLLEVQNKQKVNGYIDNNEIWYENEWQKQYLFFGESNISWYCLDLLQRVYVEIDNPSGTPMHTYGDFDAMLEKALKDSLL